MSGRNSERREKGVWDRGRKESGEGDTERRKSGRRCRDKVRGERQSERGVNK